MGERAEEADGERARRDDGEPMREKNKQIDNEDIMKNISWQKHM